MLEKRLYAVPAQAFTADGTANGVVTIAANACSLFKVKQKVVITATGLPNLELEIKQIDSEDNIQVGPIPNGKPGVNTSIDARTDISAYTVAKSAAIRANEQKRPSIDWSEAMRAMYEEEPTVAMRSVLVDECGDKINKLNPLPIAFDGTVNIGDVHVFGENGNTIEPNVDGSLNVNIVNEIPTNQRLVLTYNEDTTVVGGVSATLVSYTVPVSKKALLVQADVSGENIAQYTLLINSVIYLVKRTYFGGDLNTEFKMGTEGATGYLLNAGDTVSIQVLHNRPATGSFEGTIQVIEIS